MLLGTDEVVEEHYNVSRSNADKYASDSDADGNNDDYVNEEEEGDYNGTAYDGGYDYDDNNDDDDSDDDDIEDSDGCNTSSHVNHTPLYNDSL